MNRLTVETMSCFSGKYRFMIETVFTIHPGPLSSRDTDTSMKLSSLFCRVRGRSTIRLTAPELLFFFIVFILLQIF